MRVKLQHGEAVGVCDSRCWLSKSPVCKCKGCNGLLHGVGVETAMGQMVKLVQSERKAGRQSVRIMGQLPLF